MHYVHSENVQPELSLKSRVPGGQSRLLLLESAGIPGWGSACGGVPAPHTGGEAQGGAAVTGSGDAASPLPGCRGRGSLRVPEPGRQVSVGVDRQKPVGGAWPCTLERKPSPRVQQLWEKTARKPVRWWEINTRRHPGVTLTSRSKWVFARHSLK